MDATADELAGVVDLFGGLTHAELERALAEVAFRADGQSVDREALGDAIDRAIDEFALVRYEHGDCEDTVPLLVSGPTAFPTVPDHAEDVPHILDIEPRSLDRERLGGQTYETFVDAVDRALEAGDEDRLHYLLDVSYDLETWAPIDATADRQRLATRIE